MNFKTRLRPVGKRKERHRAVIKYYWIMFEDLEYEERQWVLDVMFGDKAFRKIHYLNKW